MNYKLISQHETDINKWAAAYFELVDDANQLAIQLLNLTKKLNGTYLIEDKDIASNVAAATKHLREYIGKYHDV